jgi:tRNA-Thr(GGU) m(6)t(6)A37 methyltransferase TsaA
MDPVVYHPIGVVRSPFDTPEDVPLKPSRSVDAAGQIELEAEYQDGLALLDGFSHIVIVAHLHLIEGYTLRTAPPFVEGVRPGIFATRGPKRPNPIGLTVVRLIDITDAVLHVEGLDLVDGTPVLDLKPHYPKPDEYRGLRGGWIEDNLEQTSE